MNCPARWGQCSVTVAPESDLGMDGRAQARILVTLTFQRSKHMTPLEVVQHGYTAFGRGDLPALLSLLADDVEWRLTADAQTPYGGKHLGKAAVQRWFGL